MKKAPRTPKSRFENLEGNLLFQGEHSWSYLYRKKNTEVAE